MPAANLLQASPWIPSSLFQAYSCAAVMPFSLAKLAQELSNLDSANFVHWSVMPGGVGEGTSLSAGLIAGDALTASVASIDCLFIIITAAGFGLFGTPLSFAQPPGGLKQMESPAIRLVQPLFIVGLKEASLPMLSRCVLRIELQVSPFLTTYVLQVRGRHLCLSVSAFIECVPKLLTNLHWLLRSNSPHTDRSESAMRLWKLPSLPISTCRCRLLQRCSSFANGNVEVRMCWCSQSCSGRILGRTARSQR